MVVRKLLTYCEAIFLPMIHLLTIYNHLFLFVCTNVGRLKGEYQYHLNVHNPFFNDEHRESGDLKILQDYYDSLVHILNDYEITHVKSKF